MIWIGIIVAIIVVLAIIGFIGKNGAKSKDSSIIQNLQDELKKAKETLSRMENNRNLDSSELFKKLEDCQAKLEVHDLNKQDSTKELESQIARYKEELESIKKVLNEIEWNGDDIEDLKDKLKELESQIIRLESIKKVLNTYNLEANDMKALEKTLKKQNEQLKIFDLRKKILKQLAEAEPRKEVAIDEKGDKIVKGTISKEGDSYLKRQAIYNKMQEAILDCVNFIDELDIINQEIQWYLDIDRSFKDWKARENKPWRENDKQNRPIIAVVGGMSAGKSSFLNDLLGLSEDTKLAAASERTTAIPAYIYHGKENKIILYGKKEEKVDITQDFKEMTADVFEDFPLGHIAECFLLETNNEALRDFTFLDTPGFSSNIKQDKQITIKALKEAQIVLFLIDESMPEESLDFIYENCLKDCYFVITKADSCKYKDGRNKTKEQLIEKLRKNGIDSKGVFLYAIQEKIQQKGLDLNGEDNDIIKRGDLLKELQTLAKKPQIMAKAAQNDFFEYFRGQIYHEVLAKIAGKIANIKKEIKKIPALKPNTNFDEVWKALLGELEKNDVGIEDKEKETIKMPVNGNTPFNPKYIKEIFKKYLLDRENNNIDNEQSQILSSIIQKVLNDKIEWRDDTKSSGIFYKYEKKTQKDEGDLSKVKDGLLRGFIKKIFELAEFARKFFVGKYTYYDKKEFEEMYSEIIELINQELKEAENENDKKKKDKEYWESQQKELEKKLSAFLDIKKELDKLKITQGT